MNFKVKYTKTPIIINNIIISLDYIEIMIYVECQMKFFMSFSIKAEAIKH